MWFTTNRICVKTNTRIYVARTSNKRLISLDDLYCCWLPQCEALRTCHSGFLIEQNGAVTRMWRSCQVQTSHKNNMRSLRFIVKRRDCCWNLSVDVALNVRLTTNGMCVKNNTHIYVTWTSNKRVISLGDLYCCLLPQCEALCLCRSGFPIATEP